MRIGAQPPTAGLVTEVVEVVLAQASLEEGARIDPWRSVALVVDLVAGAAVVLAVEEVVETDLVEGRRRGIGRDVAPDALGSLVGPGDHDRRVPANDAPDAPLH